MKRPSYPSHQCQACGHCPPHPGHTCSASCICPGVPDGWEPPGYDAEKLAEEIHQRELEFARQICSQLGGTK